MAITFGTTYFGAGDFVSVVNFNVDFGSTANPALLVRVLSAGVSGGMADSINSVVIDPAGANLTMVAAAEAAGVYATATSKARNFALAGGTMPTGVKQVRVTMAGAANHCRAWAQLVFGVGTVSAPVEATAYSAALSLTATSAAGETLAVMVSAYGQSDTSVMSITSAATLVNSRVLTTQDSLMQGAVWQQAGAASTVVTGNWSSYTMTWVMTGWRLAPGVASDTTPPVMTGTVTITPSTSSASCVCPTATDAVGVTGYAASIDGGTTWPFTSATPTVVITGLAAGNYTGQFRAFDAAGNNSTPVLSQAFTIAAAASGTVTIPALSAWTGAVMAGLTVANVVVVRRSDRVQVLALSNQVASAGGTLTITNAALVAGVGYQAMGFDATGVNNFCLPVTAA